MEKFLEEEEESGEGTLSEFFFGASKKDRGRGGFACLIDAGQFASLNQASGQNFMRESQCQAFLYKAHCSPLLIMFKAQLLYTSLRVVSSFLCLSTGCCSSARDHF